MKTLSLISRLETLTPSEFRDYYEYEHCLKAMKYFPFRLYRRNYVMQVNTKLDFDCISEVQVEPKTELIDVVGSQAWAMMKDDERRFMKPERIRFAAFRELISWQKGESREAINERRFIMIFRQEKMPWEPFCEYLREIATSLRRRLSGVYRYSVDIARFRAENNFPFDAVFWISADTNLETLLDASGDLPGLLGITEVASCESDLEVMQYRYGLSEVEI